jgi:hypothetical protein
LAQDLTPCLATLPSWLSGRLKQTPGASNCCLGWPHSAASLSAVTPCTTLMRPAFFAATRVHRRDGVVVHILWFNLSATRLSPQVGSISWRRNLDNDVQQDQ